MDNFQQLEPTNINPPENFSEPKKPINFKIIGIFILLGLVVLLSLGYLFYNNKKSVSVEQVSAIKTDCLLSGQMVEGKILENTKTKFTNLSWDPKKRSEIIAGVLNVEPFIVEVLDSTVYSFYNLGTQDYLFVSKSEETKIKSLKFNDIISGDIYDFTYAAEELAFGTAIKGIKKIKGQVKYFNDSPSSFANRSGVLIRYTPITTNSNAFMIIFNDGKVFYRDNKNSIFTDKQLTKQELESILKLFAQTNFDNIPSDFSVYRYSPSLSLTCNRYQPILLDKDLSKFKLITDKLDSIIDSYKKDATREISYDKRYIIKDWEYESIIPLDKAQAYTQEKKLFLSQGLLWKKIRTNFHK